MPLRFVEIRLPVGAHSEAMELAAGHDLIDHWWEHSDDMETHRYLSEAKAVEGLVDAVRARFGDEVRVVIMPVEATLPRSEAAEVAAPDDSPQAPPKSPSRVSREELYEDIGERIQMDPVFLTLAGVSALVACIGLAFDDNIALIGAMVIAPLLGPNVGLALATTLGDIPLARRALSSGGAGITLSFIIAVSWGAVFGVPETDAIASRLSPDFASVALALASGIAGGLAFTSGAPASLIGVMVAVALLPPLAAGGMLLGDGQITRSVSAFVLLGINLVALNLAAVATFLVQGIRPVWHSEQAVARRSAWTALLTWTLLLVTLILGLVWAQS